MKLILTNYINNMIHCLLLVLISIGFYGCGNKLSDGTSSELSGIVKLDGSSTVFPISEAVAEEFQKGNRGIRVTVGVSGTGGGMKKFGKNEIDITSASRPIKPKEIELCIENSIEFVELPVAYDGIVVVVNTENSWCSFMTVEELKLLWSPEAQKIITHWNQIRPDWPKKQIHLFGAGADSGTYDYFTKAIVGKEHSSRGDFTASEDDNVLVHGVSTNRYALGFFGYGYYFENKDKLKLISIDDDNDSNGKGPITPDATTIENGIYQPLSRPIFIYVNKQSADKNHVNAFVEFYLKNGGALASEVGYVALSDSIYKLVVDRYRNRTLGSVFGTAGSKVGVSLDKVLK